MKTSAAGRALIEQREGRRLAAYRDSKGILTIGVGHTGRMSEPPVTIGMTINEAQCDAMLATDLAPVEQVLNTAVKVPISQNEFDALASLGFNIGAPALRRSTVIKMLNRGDVPGSAQAFMIWSKPAVLVSRRKAEMGQFLSRAPPDSPASRSLAAARAATLATMAEATKAKAGAAQAGAAALIAAGTATSVATHAYHLLFALVAGGFLITVGVVTALVAICGHRTAATLAANAGRQNVASQGAPSRNAPTLALQPKSSLKPSDRTTP